MTRARSSLTAILSCAAILFADVGGTAPPDHPGLPRGRYVCTLTGTQASPPNGSLAVGSGEIRLRGDRVRVRFSWRGLSGAATGLHVHAVTATGEAGPVQFDIIPGILPEGTEGPIDLTLAIDPAQRELLREDRMYADVHTRIYPGGEIRGTFVREPED